MSVPQITACPSCFTVDEVTAHVDYMNNEWVFTCRGNDHGDAPHEWRKPIPSGGENKQYREGYFSDLGVYEVLLRCIAADDPWLEYGVVEDRFRRFEPELYARLVTEFSHSARSWRRGGPDLRPVQIMTTSMRLSHALGVLYSEGLIAFRNAPASGYWHYLGRVSHWAPVPPPPDDRVLKWAAYADEAGLDPDDWQL